MTHFTGTIIISIIFCFAGFLSLLVAVCNWDWFFKSQNAMMLTGRFKRRTARIVYFVLGCLILIMATINASPLFN
ncbi:MAG: immunity 17 family protein [Muribaculaceae bacterium]